MSHIPTKTIEPFFIESQIDISPLLLAFDQFHEALKVAKTDLEKAGTIQYFEFTSMENNEKNSISSGKRP